VPIASHGSEDFRDNLRRLRRTDFHVRVGEPIVISAPQGLLRREERTKILNRIMRGIATLLPRQYRGAYEG
jgi:hypothetical protein